MKKLLVILMMVFSLGCYAQDTITFNKPVYINTPTLYEYPEAYFEFGFGAMIPTDNSNEYNTVKFELGKYINGIFGLGLEYQTGSESEYHDHLSYVGINTRYKLNPFYDPNKMIRLEAIAGIGYGWYSYITGYDYDYYYYDYTEFRTKYSYIVPKFGVNAYVSIIDNLHIGLGSEFAWYISTNRENSLNVGVVNIFAKIKYNF